MGSTMRSGGTRKMDAAKQALQTVLADVPDDADVGVRALNSTVDGSHWIVPLAPVDRQKINQQIKRIYADGGTPLGAAMKDAADALLAARDQNVYGSYRLLIVTDGEATDQNLVDTYLPEIRSRGLVTDVIGVDMSGQHSLATKVNTYRRADDPDSLTQAIAKVFAETGDQDSGAGQSDYEMLNGIPDEVASAAVQSLTKMNNEPILGTTQRSTANSPAATPFPINQRPAAVPARTSGNRGGGMVGVCVGGFFMLFVVVVFLGILSQAARNKPR
jgi:uncharacterized protein YegL